MDVSGISLEGKVALVTGASRGIGKAISLTFAAAGADVALCSRSRLEALDGVAEGVRAQGRRALAMRADVSRTAEVEKVVDSTVRELGTIDVLVNNAGIIYRTPLLDTPEAQWDEIMDVNLKGYFLCCQAVGRIMKGQKSGVIINMSSRLGLKAQETSGAYCVAKAGVVMMTEVLALEMASCNVRVNAIAPGLIETDMTADLRTVPEVFTRLRQAIPMGRAADPAEIARVALFLASDASSYMTGQTISVDGGRNL
jgi:3-oxoacyl-[acyl-carrier protein] reductase